MGRVNNNEYLIQVGERLRNCRENLGYTREEFAKALDVTADHYRKIENGKVRLNTGKIVTLHNQYKVDINYLLTGEPNSILYKGKEYGSLDELWDESDEATKLELCKEVLEFQNKVEQRKAKQRLKQ